MTFDRSEAQRCGGVEAAHLLTLPDTRLLVSQKRCVSSWDVTCQKTAWAWTNIVEAPGLHLPFTQEDLHLAFFDELRVSVCSFVHLFVFIR